MVNYDYYYNPNIKGIHLSDYIKSKEFHGLLIGNHLKISDGVYSRAIFLNDEKSSIKISPLRSPHIHLNSSEREIREANNLLLSLFPEDSLTRLE